MTPLQRAAVALVDALKRNASVFGQNAPIEDTSNLRELMVDGGLDAIEAARAVLSAIREPSEGMKARGADRVGDTRDFASGDYVASETWQAMIDHMLAEERPYSIVGERIDFVFREDGTLAESE